MVVYLDTLHYFAVHPKERLDFASYACTIDCNIYNNIGTVLNAGNVTVIGSCDESKGYKKYSKYDWKDNHIVLNLLDKIKELSCG